MITVTKTFLPPQHEFDTILKRAWYLGWLTNRGILVEELEERLKKYLKTEDMFVTTNGTLPIQIALKALDIHGEVITTPLSYVATTSSIVWEGCTPVFVDIHPDYLTIDETLIEAAITPKTTAILSTHVYGNPCHVEAIAAIARKHGLKVIYDAAHCFGVRYNDQSIFNYGDVSTCSFHATKIFHTGEGGALFCNNKDLLKKCFYMHNFGHKGQEEFHGLGINAKMSELQAAMGLAVLPYMEEILSKRKQLVEGYQLGLKKTALKLLKIREKTDWNYSYFPVVFPSEDQLLMACSKLNNDGIFPRRYFYPSLEKLPYIDSKNCVYALSISPRLLCLPLSHDLMKPEQDQIINIIKSIV